MSTPIPLQFALDRVTVDLLSDALLRSGRTLAAEVTCRLEDHLKQVNHLTVQGPRTFRYRHEIMANHLPVAGMGAPVSGITIQINVLSAALLESAAWSQGRAIETEAALRLKDSLALYLSLGDQGQRQWRVGTGLSALRPRQPVAFM